MKKEYMYLYIYREAKRNEGFVSFAICPHGSYFTRGNKDLPLARILLSFYFTILQAISFTRTEKPSGETETRRDRNESRGRNDR